MFKLRNHLSIKARNLLKDKKDSRFLKKKQKQKQDNWLTENWNPRSLFKSWALETTHF